MVKVPSATKVILRRKKILTTIIIATFIYALILSYTNKAKPMYYYESREPIDVVYTWVNGSDPLFLRNINGFLNSNNGVEERDVSYQRFDDKYELKFSLRSLEKYAPWIRHVYIVTNGQIPYWLSLDYERVTIITHKEIFLDSYDLPTFSSPAIESHIHRIPGLSKKFIYFNDDIFLGSPLYLDDFYSDSRGYLLYLGWPLPMCANDCPWVYVADGQCDNSCFNANCQYDGGDCENEAATAQTRHNDNLEMDYYSGESANYPAKKMKKLDKLSTNSSQIKYTLQIAKYQPKTNHSNFIIRSLIAKKRKELQKLLSQNVTTNLTQKVVNDMNKHVMSLHKLNRRNRKKHLKPYVKKILFNATSSLINKIKHINNNIDAYSASLQHTNRIFNFRYGFQTRYVPAHSPILIDTDVMNELQEKFRKEFRITSRNRVRSKDDMQYEFSYYYFIMHEKKYKEVAEIFDQYDTDSSRTWSDREIRTILTKLYELPLSYTIVDHFEAILSNCSRNTNYFDVPPTPEYERYIDSKLPTISRDLVINCVILRDILVEHLGTSTKYNHEVLKNINNKLVTFKMINSNITEVVSHLDEIRKKPTKFICLNDNMDHTKQEENDLVRAILYDFYLSFFPNPSKFELPTEYRNRFLYMDELNEWKAFHFKLKFIIYIVVALILIYFAYITNVCCKRRHVCSIINKLMN